MGKKRRDTGRRRVARPRRSSGGSGKIIAIVVGVLILAVIGAMAGGEGAGTGRPGSASSVTKSALRQGWEAGNNARSGASSSAHLRLIVSSAADDAVFGAEKAGYALGSDAHSDYASGYWYGATGLQWEATLGRVKSQKESSEHLDRETGQFRSWRDKGRD